MGRTIKHLCFHLCSYACGVGLAWFVYLSFQWVVFQPICQQYAAAETPSTPRDLHFNSEANLKGDHGPHCNMVDTTTGQPVTVSLPTGSAPAAIGIGALEFLNIILLIIAGAGGMYLGFKIILLFAQN